MVSDRDPTWRLKGSARVMRHNSTEAERLLWSQLRNSQLNGIKFRRQVPIDGFIIDFYSIEHRFGIELDGAQHGDDEAVKYDQRRSSILSKRGIRLLRVANSDVLKDLPAVLRTVLREVGRNPHPNPLPEYRARE